VLPLRRIRNLDVLAALSLVVSVVLFQQRYLATSVIAALPCLVYLMLRCLWLALGAGAPAAPCTPC
jgi:hypothetical protein